MYTPDNLSELKSILEALEVYCRVEGYSEASEALADTRILLVKETQSLNLDAAAVSAVDD
ncbi:MAG: hypothetical protein AAGE38_01800 [Pseudomonadota bacterium]